MVSLNKSRFDGFDQFFFLVPRSMTILHGMWIWCSFSERRKLIKVPSFFFSMMEGVSIFLYFYRLTRLRTNPFLNPNTNLWIHNEKKSVLVSVSVSQMDRVVWTSCYVTTEMPFNVSSCDRGNRAVREVTNVRIWSTKARIQRNRLRKSSPERSGRKETRDTSREKVKIGRVGGEPEVQTFWRPRQTPKGTVTLLGSWRCRYYRYRHD